MVRSNPDHNLGFLVEERRLNVAVTRAKRQLVLICDSETVCKNKFLSGFIKYMRDNGVIEDAKLFQRKIIVPIKSALVKDSQNNNLLIKKELFPKLINVVGLDCEMVGVGEEGRESRLARISIVDNKGSTLLDEFVKPDEKVIDYRTKKSGIRKKDLVCAKNFKTVKDAVSMILEDKIIVGHGLDHDFEVMDCFPDDKIVRDTAQYFKFGKTPSLKSLVLQHLNEDIQKGEHNSLEDAFCAMKLYLRYRDEWESQIISSKTPKFQGKFLEKKKDKKKAPISNKVNKKTSGGSAFSASNHSQLQSQSQSQRTKNRRKRNDKSKVEINGLTNALSKLNVGPKVSKFERLKTLKPDHVFKRRDFTSSLNSPFFSLDKRSANKAWATVWIKIRKDKQSSTQASKGLPIIAAFNKLSNQQLQLWIEMQK